MINILSYSPSIDIIYPIDNFVAGETYTQISPNRFYAGKAINVARVAALLGEDVTISGIIPKAEKNNFVHFLESLNINSNLMTIDGLLRINTTIIDKKNDNTTHISTKSSKLTDRISEDAKKFVASNIKSDSNWIITGSLPTGFHDKVYADLIEQITSQGGRVTLDTSQKALEYGIRAKPAIIKPNLLELESFFDEEIRGVHHIALKGKRLIDMGIEYVFISLGSDGMIALHKNDCLLCSPPNVEVVNTVGSGDALVAGISVALRRGFSFSESCRLAIACGTSNATHVKTGVIDRDNIWKLMEQVDIKSV